MMKLLYILAIIVTLNCSAYCDKGITASGEYVRDGICAMDRVNGTGCSFWHEGHPAQWQGADCERPIWCEPQQPS